MAQTIRVLGLDIAKLVLHVVGMDDTGHVVRRKRLARREWRHFIAILPPVCPENPKLFTRLTFSAFLLTLDKQISALADTPS